MKSNVSLSSRAELSSTDVPAHLLIIVLFSFFEPWMALNSELFSYLTSLIIDTFKYIVQLLHPLWGVAALFCGVANLSMSFELNGAPLSDSRRPRVDPTRATLVGRVLFIGSVSSRGSFGAPAILPTTSLVLEYFANSVEYKQDGVIAK